MAEELILGGKNVDDIRQDLGKKFSNAFSFEFRDEAGIKRFQIVYSTDGQGFRVTEVILGKIYDNSWRVEAYNRFPDGLTKVETKFDQDFGLIILNRPALGALIIKTSFEGQLTLGLNGEAEGVSP